MNVQERYLELVKACKELIDNASPNGQSACNSEHWYGTFTISGHRIEKIHKLIDHRKCQFTKSEDCPKCSL